MHRFDEGDGRCRPRTAGSLLVLFALPAFLGACSGIGQNDRPDDISADYFTVPGYCPVVRVRGGTKVYTLYERGHEGDPEFVRYQGSITETARECRETADGFSVKIGIAGRVVAGPKGGQGSVTMPIRVALTQQSTGVKFSELYDVPVNIVPPALNAEFSQVVDWIPVSAAPNEKNFIIYVGFDEGTSG